MNKDQEGLKHALLDVRKAFRLLWLYQRRVTDIVHLITDQFDHHEFYCWDTMSDRPPGRMTTDPTDNWIWAMLPFYQLCLLYLPSDAVVGQPKKGEWLLEISIQSDDGFPAGEDEAEPDPTQFATPETCNSFLYLRAWYCKKAVKLNWYSQIWEQIDWPEDGHEFVEHNEPPVAIVTKEINFLDLPDKAAVDATVAEFKAAIKKHLGLSFDVGNRAAALR
jgi:hypothetical protein